MQPELYNCYIQYISGLVNFLLYISKYTIIMTKLSAFVISALPPVVITLSYFRHLRTWIKRNVEIPKYIIEG
jgi:hypothetical protein